MLKKIALGQLLVQEKLISEEQLKTALEERKKTGEHLKKVLVEFGFVKEDAMLEFLAKQLQLPLYHLNEESINVNVAKKLSEAYAYRFHVLLLKEQDDGYLLGTTDLLDIHAQDELKHALKKPIYLALISEKDLSASMDIVYRKTEEIDSLAQELQEAMNKGIDLAALSEESEQSDAPVIKLIQALFEDAVRVGASDIHIEPTEKALRVRLRIDGVLYEQIVEEKSIAPAVALRVKLMAGLNIAEKRLPQDGRFTIKVRKHVLDIRVSTLPMQYGESIVMRILDQSADILKLDQLGMSKEVLERVQDFLAMPNGILLITGPTGSGKTTTLYAMLSELNSVAKNIITAEDPIEYRLSNVNQVQVSEKLGFTFARILRSMLRQDPDIIMVGEVRDRETADISMRAALTGHLVLSTLHTNDSASSALRLLDMGVPGYLIAASVRCVIAQRLVRRLCDNCKLEYEPTSDEKEWLKGVYGENVLNETFYEAEGCSYCHQSKYKGRVGLYELLELNEEMSESLRSDNPHQFAQEAEKSLKGKLLKDSGLKLVTQGMTTIQELIRILGEN